MSETSGAPGHVRIDNRLVTHYAPRVGAHALAVYLVLALHAHARTRQCYPSTRTISRLAKLSRPTVLKAICTLEEEGLIKVERKRTKRGEREVNVYTLLPIGGGQPALPPVVNDVDHVGQSPLPSMVKQIDHIGKGALPEQDLINKTQENKGAAPRAGHPPASGARPPTPVRQPDKQPCDPTLDHRAVKEYRAQCKLTPNAAQRVAIVEVVTDMERWQEVLRKWLLAGYRPTNVAGMLDWYRNGIPERSGGNGRNGATGRSGYQGGWGDGRRERRQPETADDVARRDAEWQKLVRESETRS